MIKRIKRGINKLSVLSLILFILLAVWLFISTGNAGSAVDEKRAASVYASIMNGASLCYSIEGEYPTDLEYLEEAYGVSVNTDKYAIDYRYFGANIRPTVTVVEKESD